MTLERQKSVKAVISLLLALCITPGYARGALTEPGADAKDKTVKPTPGHQITARLVARGNLPVLVNGNGSYTGTTILSGATIRTPSGVRATVQLGEMGNLDLAPNTIAVVDFSSDAIKGTLKQGCAVLTTNANVNGMLVTPEGASMVTDKSRRSSVNLCSSQDAQSPAVTNSAPPTRRGMFGFGPDSTLALIGASGFFVGRRAISHLGGGCCCCCCCRNPSPSSPNNCCP